MIEGNNAHEEKLKAVGFPFEIALLSSHRRNLTFFQGPGHGTGSTVFRENSDIEMVPVTVSAVSVDEVLVKHQVGTAELLKIDIQGSELAALKGAGKILQSVEVILAEAPLMNYNEGSPSFLSLYNFLDKKGFALFAVSDITRISTGIAIQFDPTFVRKTSKLWSKECTGFPTPAYFNTSN
eukprot:gene25143-33663_t